MTKKKENKVEWNLKDERIPHYYIGNNGYEARKVVAGFDLSYNIGTAVTYLLRAEKKHATPTECIKKAIAHLEFEIEKIESNKHNLNVVGGKL